MTRRCLEVGAALAVGTAVALVVACGSDGEPGRLGSVAGDAASGDDATLKGIEGGTGSDAACCGSSPLARVSARVERVTDGGSCAGTIFLLGGHAERPFVANGASVGAGQADVSCTVRADGAGFIVAARASISGQTGSVEISGRTDATPPRLDAVFVAGDGTRVEQSDCAVVFPSTYGPAPGRIGATLTCPPLASQGTEACGIVATLIFDGCAQ